MCRVGEFFSTYLTNAYPDISTRLKTFHPVMLVAEANRLEDWTKGLERATGTVGLRIPAPRIRVPAFGPSVFKPVKHDPSL